MTGQYSTSKALLLTEDIEALRLKKNKQSINSKCKLRCGILQGG